MDLFRTPPSNPFLHLPAAIAAGAVLGTVLFALVDVIAFGARATPADFLGEIVFISVVALLAGGVLWLTYALPLLMFLLHVGRAGPASMLLVAVVPPALAALGSVSLGLFFACYMVSAGLVFVRTAYRADGRVARFRDLT